MSEETYWVALRCLIQRAVEAVKKKNQCLFTDQEPIDVKYFV